MKTWVVMTSIFPPSRAVHAYARRADVKIVVVGDRKTPEWPTLPGVTFLPTGTHAAVAPRLSKLLPYDHYSRKMIGYVYAIRNGATEIFDTDDDNCPTSEWERPAFEGQYDCTPRDRGFVNVYRFFTDAHVWPRGFPLQRIRQSCDLAQELTTEKLRIGIWQGLVDGEPDVDAIYRLVLGYPLQFHRRPPVVLAPGSSCPFNSQNTFFDSLAFPLLYLPAEVTFRFTDILRGLVAQPVLWAHGLHLGFRSADVYQDRNPHDLLADFRSEIPCYLQAEDVVETTLGCEIGRRSVAESLCAAYEGLERKGIVSGTERNRLAGYLADIGV